MLQHKNYDCFSNYSKDTAENQSISIMRKENFQILPAKKRRDSNDKTTKLFFAPADEEVINGKMLILEPTRRGAKKIITKITFDVGVRFTAFDREVLNACTSQFVEGFDAISIGIIYRLMTGKKSTHLADSMRIAILDSLINKLISTNVTIDASQVCTVLKYNGGNPFTYTGAILPAQIVEGKIRGKESTIVKIEKLPPLYELAALRHRKKKDGGQILTYDVDLLNVGNTNTSIDNILIKNHTLRRIFENRHKEMSNRITLEEILKTTGISKTSCWQSQDLRNYIDSMLKCWQRQGIFEGYKWLKKYARFYGFEIFYKD